MIRSLLDNLTWERVEVDMIRFDGPAFAGLDNRLMALQLVEQDLTEAAMFTAEGEAVQWAEVLYKKPVLVQRGSFNPLTHAALDVLERAHERFVAEPELQGETPVVLVEMTLRHLTTGTAINHADFLQRADMLRALGRTVWISNFRRFHRLAWYLSRVHQSPASVWRWARSNWPRFSTNAFTTKPRAGCWAGWASFSKIPPGYTSIPI